MSPRRKWWLSPITPRSSGGGTLYLDGGAAPSELQTHAGGGYQWNNYIVAGGDVIAQRVHEVSQTPKTLYFHKDHLGSISTITNDAGAVVERLSYDPWGKRRNIDGTDDSAGAIASSASRGFTCLPCTPEVACGPRDAGPCA